MVSPMRTSTALSVVRDTCAVPVPAGASVSERIRHLQAEAKLLAREQIQALENALLQIERLSCEIADGGEAYPVGVREVAGRLAEDCVMKVQTLEAIASRN